MPKCIEMEIKSRGFTVSPRKRLSLFICVLWEFWETTTTRRNKKKKQKKCIGRSFCFHYYYCFGFWFPFLPLFAWSTSPTQKKEKKANKPILPQVFTKETESFFSVVCLSLVSLSFSLSLSLSLSKVMNSLRVSAQIAQVLLVFLSPIGTFSSLALRFLNLVDWIYLNGFWLLVLGC